MRFKKLQTNLLLLFLLLSLVPLTLLGVFFVTQTYKNYTAEQQNMQHTIEETALRVLDEEKLALQQLATTLAQDPELLRIIEAPSREQMTAQMKALYTRLQQEHALTIVELGDVNGTVLIRGHAPSQYGDRKKDVPSIESALLRKSSSGIEQGSSGLSVRAFVPVEKDGRVIATLQIGVADRFLHRIEQALQQTAVHLAQRDGTVIRSTTSQSIGEKLAIEEALNGTVARMKEGALLRSDLPIYDPSAQQVVAVLRIEQNIAAAQQNIQTLVVTLLCIFAVTLVVSIAAASYFSRSITKPIVAAAQAAEQFAHKNLHHDPVLSTRQDEIGQLTNNMRTLQCDLTTTLQTVQSSATTLSQKSIDLDVATKDIAAGANSVSTAMDNITDGAEQQTAHITLITDHMEQFSHTVATTAEESNTLQQLTTHSLSMSEQGAQFMSEAQQKMQHVEQLMHRSVDDLHALEEQSSHISSFVAIIENVANETNLLALNASIEAARAGEHGKGFAVVAEEVRHLAEQTAKSVHEITTLVQTIQQRTSTLQQSLQSGAAETVTTAQALDITAQSFTHLTSSIQEVAQFVNHLHAQFTTITHESTSIYGALQQMTSVTEETTASIEETTATMQETTSTMMQISVASEQLAALSKQLEEIVQQYALR